MKTPRKPKMYNLEQHNSVDGKSRKISTHLWNTPYGVCKWRKDILESDKKIAKGTFFKIVET